MLCHIAFSNWRQHLASLDWPFLSILFHIESTCDDLNFRKNSWQTLGIKEDNEHGFDLRPAHSSSFVFATDWWCVSSSSLALCLGDCAQKPYFIPSYHILKKLWVCLNVLKKVFTSNKCFAYEYLLDTKLDNISCASETNEWCNYKYTLVTCSAASLTMVKPKQVIIY